MAALPNGDVVATDPWDLIEVLLDDSAWLDAEFAAVMAASGIHDEATALSSRLPEHEKPLDDRAERPTASDRDVTTGREARTRSPPTR